DLLAHQQLGAIGHLLDRVRDVLGVVVGGLLVGHRPMRLRMKAATIPPANAAPTRISGCSSTGRLASGPGSVVPEAAGPGGWSVVASAAPTTGVGSGPAVVGLWRSSLTQADLPRRLGAKSLPRHAWWRSTPAHPGQRAGPTRSGA